ncbi:MAG: squalene synthase HpnC [Pseudomonadota bacterium]
MSVDHYENFPVASFLMPARLKPAVVAIYAFARTADDIADEGDATPEQRYLALDQYDKELVNIQINIESQNKLFQSLATHIRTHQLPISAFHDLISAFKQDVYTKRYETYDDLLDYCRRSANPVGTIMLHLYQAETAQNLKDSDAICSALQLINFWQDIAIDWQKQRIYVPLEDLLRFKITEQQIESRIVDANWQEMMQFQILRTRTLMISGSPLCKRLPGRIGWELRLVVQGGLRILERLEKVNGDIFQRRPKLKSMDWLFVIWRAVWM